MGQHTALYQQHLKAGAKLVDFAGWDMPIHYGSQINEHHQVRRDAGVFDVSHMTVVDITGPDAQAYLRYLLANDVKKLTPGKAIYTCMLNEQGGIVDDLIVYQLGDNYYRLVLNAGTRAKDLPWLTQYSQKFQVKIQHRADLGIIAVQGPQARRKAQQAFTAAQNSASQNLAPFTAALVDDWLIARTGYTGEDGFEVILPVAQAADFWQALLNAEIQPCGLGARDTLRLEAGLNLYGADMDENTSPLESNLSWTVAWEPNDRNFIGRSALTSQRQAGIKRNLVGLILAERGILRNHQSVLIPDDGAGEITSGSFSPTLNCSIALARIPTAKIDQARVEIRGKSLPVQIIKPPFVRHGKKLF